MRFTISRRWPIVALGLWLAGASPGHGQERIDITQIYEQFVMAKAAAGKCGAQAADLDRTWSANFMGVMLRTIETLKARNPSVPESQIGAAMQGRTTQLRTAVESSIDREGCASANSQRLQRLYRVQASMRLP